MRPKLTIAIPTYNRVDKLLICIERVLQQTEGKPVDLVIVDNASTDATQEILEKINNNRFSYYRNDTNVGPDKNFLRGYEVATGEYVMLLGDDDYLLPGAIDSILNALSKNPVMVYSDSCSLKKEKPFKYSKSRFDDIGLCIYEDKDQFFEQVDIFVTFMSAMVLKTDSVRKIQNKEQYIGTYFIQSYIAFEVMKEPGIYIVNTHNCIAASPNRTVGYDLYFVWGEQYHKLLFEKGISSGVSREMIETVYQRDMSTIIYDFVLSFRITCKNEKSWKKEYILNHTLKYNNLREKYDKAVNGSLIYVFIIKILRMVGLK